MPYYRQLGEVPHKRHTQFRRPNGALYTEELQGEEGFSSESSLLYHRFPPTAITAAEAVEREPLAMAPNHPLKPRHHRTHDLKDGGDVVEGRQVLLANDDVTLSYVAADESSPLYRNAVGDELLYIEDGTATFESIYGALQIGKGDYLVIPTSCTYRVVPSPGAPLRTLVFEARGHISPPRRYLSARGQFLEHAPYCERDIRGPERLVEVPDGPADVLVRHSTGWTRYTYAHHPFDVVGWDGHLYPWVFNIGDFEPITGRVHQPPPVHQTFEGPNFVVCSFVPRKFDYHPLSIPAPYSHANVDSDEVLFYADGDFMSRKGSAIAGGSISLHPAGFTHGPQPGAAEASIGAEATEETAVMLDTFRPLHLGPAALESEDPDYAWSWAPR